MHALVFQKEQTLQKPMFQTCKSAKFSPVPGGMMGSVCHFFTVANRVADTSPNPDGDARKSKLFSEGVLPWTGNSNFQSLLWCLLRS